MNLLPLTCRLCRNVPTPFSNLSLVRRSIVKFPSKHSKKILISIVPLIPSVTAKEQSIVESKDKVAKQDSISPSTSNKNDTNDRSVVEESGWDRLRAMYEYDEYGNMSKEMAATVQSTYLAAFVGFLYGGIKYSRVALKDFMERNEATIFYHPYDAKKRLQNHVTLHFCKGAFKWGWRLAAFTGGFMLFLTSLSVYNNRVSILDYSLSGAGIGALLRFRVGPAGMVIGGTVGGILGLFCGLTTKALLTFTGTSLDEIIAFQYEIDRSRYNVYKEGEKKSFEKNFLSPEVVELIKAHESSKKD